MAKSVPNPKFVAMAVAAFAPHGFARRAPGQRRMADLLPLMLFEQTEQGYSAQMVGSGYGYNSAGQVTVCEYLVVTCPCGTRVPAYRWAPGYNICQEFNYVPA